MPITRTAKGTAQQKTSSSSWTAIGGASLAAGTLGVVTLATGGLHSNVSSVTWGGHAMAKAVGADDPTPDVSGSIWYYFNDTGGTVTGDIVVNYTEAKIPKALAAIEVNGDPQVRYLDKSAGGSGNSDSPSSGATAATVEADEYMQGCVATQGPNGDLAGLWGGDTAVNGQRLGTTGGVASGNMTVSEAYGLQVATGTRTASKTGITAREWAACIATFRQHASLPTRQRERFARVVRAR